MDERARMFDRDLKNPPFCSNINVQACAIRCKGANREWAGHEIDETGDPCF